MPAPRRNVRSTSDGGSAVQPPGLSYTAHWEALGCALCLLTTPEISSTDPMRGRGFCPGSHRPRACVPLVVCGPETFCFADSLPQSPGPGPCSPAVFCSAICDCLSINGCFYLLSASWFCLWSVGRSCSRLHSLCTRRSSAPPGRCGPRSEELHSGRIPKNCHRMF